MRLRGTWAWAALAAAGAAQAAEPGAVDYEAAVRPILAERCYTCHSAEAQKGGLRLDHKPLALQGGDSGAVLIPGQASASALFERITSDDPAKRMPPKGAPLAPEQIETLRAWIDAGAPWPEPSDGPATVISDHWAFKPIQRVEAPAVKDASWPANAIDAFVLARLEAEGAAPSPQADQTTLMRRLHFDLTGLPPTPEEARAFLEDDGPYAYERLVSRLLASPHFGERWGRHWLDLARYADSDGYEKDSVRPYAYRYRDWVIDAFNRDLPYDRFVIEQLAGDLLPNASLDQRIATGFHRNTLTNREGGIDPEEDRVKQAADRADTTAAVFLGLTMGCAQCHTHKYDPITQREYYEFFAFFNRAQEADIAAPLPGEVQAYETAKARWDGEVAKANAAIAEYRPELAKSLPAWEAELNLPGRGWEVADPISYLSAGGATLEELDDKSVLAKGDSPANDVYTVVIKVMETEVRAIRLEAMTHESLPSGGPGRGPSGNFDLREFTVTASPVNDPQAAVPVKIVSATADFAEPELVIENAIDGDPETGWAIYTKDDMNQTRTANFVFEKPVGFPLGTIFSFTLDHRRGRAHNIGRMRLAYTTVDPSVLAIPDAAFDALRTPPDQRSEEQQIAAVDYFGLNDAKMRELKAKLQGLLDVEPAPPSAKAQAIVAAADPPQTYIHLRGDFLSRGDVVAPATLAVLQPMRAKNETPNRLDLAEWIVDPANPLTARVQVNRIWAYLFGRGLVATPEDFGTQGEPPTHPELLDWLASEYVARGWSTKDLIRLIVSSSAYRQASAVREDLWERDPYNKLLARQNRFRVEAEIVRDAWLHASGLLHPVVGGPSVRPQLPAGVAMLGFADQVRWEESPAPDKHRRGIYIHFQRTVPYPTLMNFDCPDSNVTAAGRQRSNTPLQALNTLNGPAFFECAQTLGNRVYDEGLASDSERIDRMFRICLTRDPIAAERDRLLAFVQDQRAIFERSGADAAVGFASNAPNENAEAVDRATMVALARVIMNLDEFITRE